MEKTILYFKILIMGILFSEYIIFSNVIMDNFLATSISQPIFLLGKTYISALILYYTVVLFKKMLVLFKNSRWDLVCILVFSFIFGFAFSDISYNFIARKMKFVSQLQMTVLLSIPLIVRLSAIIRDFQLKNSKKANTDSAFIPDNEGKTKADDHFKIHEQAVNFAEMVYDNGSTESLVFGIDAPWGAGKSTFVNLCREFWKDNYEDKLIIYSFDPLKYETKEKLLSVFITGLIKEIRNHVYAPEIEILVSKYGNLLKDTKITFPFLSFNLAGVPVANESIDSIITKLEPALLNIDKKIIIIIDDLDRLDFSVIKEVLFVIKKSFTLPNISYVLCYDTENLTAFENQDLNKDKVIEFLEKFINIKFSIYLDSNMLLEYFTNSKNQSLTKNPTINPLLIAKAVVGLKDIFRSKEFHHYRPFIGDARKIKRLINTIILLQLEKADYDNCDFDQQDLIHLLLIYINYPNIFRKIYYTETQGKNGFFSVTYTTNSKNINKEKTNRQVSFGSVTYANSNNYIDYLNTLNENQKFLLNKIFNVERLENTYGDNQTEKLNSLACFNESKFRNLEKYIKFIVTAEQPNKTEHIKFYSNLVNDYLSDKSSLRTILSTEELAKETNQILFWNVLINTPRREISTEKYKEIINYAIEVLPNYSLLEKHNDFSFRTTFSIYITKFLDKMASSTKGIDVDTSIAADIASWIISEDSYKENGIMNMLWKRSQNITSLFDLLNFRLHCCVNRGGDISYLSYILTKHGNPNAPTEGETRYLVIEEMRELSQKTFQFFKEKYIDNQINLFDTIDALTLEMISGSEYQTVKSLPNITEKLLSLKSSLKHFITYQLGTKNIDLGIGCGYYNVNGKVNINEITDENTVVEVEVEKHGIHYEINKYLFDVCFNPVLNVKNYEHFLDYLIILTSTSFNFFGTQYTPTINDFKTVLDQAALENYWKKNKDKIKEKQFNTLDKKIHTINIVLSYKDCLDSIFAVLDQPEKNVNESQANLEEDIAPVQAE